MKISKERAKELEDAWFAASDIERLRLNRVSWVGGIGEVDYYETEPSGMEISAAKRIAELEGIASCLLDSYLTTFEGSKDALVHRAEKAIPNWKEIAENFNPTK